MTAPPRSTKAQAAQHETFEAIIPNVSQALAFSSASAQGSALALSTTLVRLFCSQDCFITVGSNPTALGDGTSMFIPSGIVDFIGVQGGQKIAAIRSTNDGTLYITEAQ